MSEHLQLQLQGHLAEIRSPVAQRSWAAAKLSKLRSMP